MKNRSLYLSAGRGVYYTYRSLAHCGLAHRPVPLLIEMPSPSEKMPNPAADTHDYRLLIGMVLAALLFLLDASGFVSL